MTSWKIFAQVLRGWNLAKLKNMEAGSDMNIGGEKHLIPIDEKLFARVTEISESKHIPPESLTY